jgi:DNA-binding MarR family transcriptional regulator
MRQLEVDLMEATGLALADFDVFAQLARADGELRMTELAARALISRSGMVRRVARLVREGIVRRGNADTDARGVVVALTDAGVARLTETAPVHLRGVAKLFVSPLDEQELAALNSALDRSSSTANSGESPARPVPDRPGLRGRPLRGTRQRAPRWSGLALAALSAVAASSAH